MSKEHKPRAFGPLIVVPNGDGKYAIVDGGHRWQAAKLQGQASVPCWILPPAGLEQQAEDFVELNTQRAKPNSNERFVAGCTAGKERELTFLAVLNKHHIGICKGEGKSCDMMKSMSDVLKHLSAAEFDAGLEFVNECWPAERGRLAASFLDAVRMFADHLRHDCAGWNLMTADVRERFRQTPWDEIVRERRRQANAGTISSRKQYLYALAMVHNRRRQRTRRVRIIG